MIFEQIRNATIRLTYGGKTFLVDPWLAPKGALGSFDDLGEGAAVRPEQAALKMPLCDLPRPVSEILAGVDAYIITHIHVDHIDQNLAGGTCGAPLDKTVLTFVQSDDDRAVLEKSGFQRVQVLSSHGSTCGRVTLIKTPGRHGTEQPCGPASGVIFQATGERTVYVAGDTIFYEGVAKTLQQYEPDVIITNNCAAELGGFGRLIMDDGDMAEIGRLCPDATLIASHMDTVAHATLTRETLREKLAAGGMAGRVRIPADGEQYDL